ncbi:MAG: PhzF family phenazine biosynthesis protein, partial [Hyphomicrobiaceae bacterium]
MAALDYHVLDVFTKQRFGGNPLAVVLDADQLDSRRMQSIAREFNLSETVFVLKPSNAAHTARVRIFTPAAEMPFAGHPTVGTASLLAELRMPPTH